MNRQWYRYLFGLLKGFVQGARYSTVALFAKFLGLWSPLTPGKLKVMSAIEQCRGAALGGHVLRCEACGTDQVSYNCCRNWHCPTCQIAAAQRWLDARQDDLLPIEYFHVVFTLPGAIADLAHQNKAEIYGLLFDMAAEVLQVIAADAKHLGARIGATLVLHTWGAAASSACARHRAARRALS